MKNKINTPTFDLKRIEDIKVAISQVSPMDINFGNRTVTEYELLVLTIYRLNELIKVTNEYTDLINEIILWILNEGLEEAVLYQLNVWLDDGTLENLINETLFNKKLDKTVFEEFLILYEEKVQNIENRLGGIDTSIDNLELSKLDKSEFNGEVSRIDDELAQIESNVNDLVQISLRNLGAKTKEEDPNFDNTPILKNAIIKANAMGGNVKITMPKGTIVLKKDNDIPAVITNNVWFSGQGQGVSTVEVSDGTYFKFGSMDGVSRGGGFENFTLVHTNPSVLTPTIKVFYGFGQTMRYVSGENLTNLIELGEQGLLYGIKPQTFRVENCIFRTAIGIAGITTIRANIGAVLEIHDTFAQVPEVPSMDPSVGSPVKDYVTFLEVNGTWDTINISNLYLHQYYDGIKYIADNPNPTAQVPRDDIITTTLTNCVFDYIKNSCFTGYASDTGNIVGVRINGGLYNTSDGHCFDFVTGGSNAYISNVKMNGVFIGYSGKCGIRFLGSNIRNLEMNGVSIRAPKQKLPVDDETSDGILIGTSVTDFIITNSRVWAGLREGYTLNNSPGITLQGLNTNYNVSDNVAERFVVTLPATNSDSNLSMKRQMKDNVFTGNDYTKTYSGRKSTGVYEKPASAQPWYNVTPFDIEVIVYGGSVSLITKGYLPSGSTAISSSTNTTFMLRPGEYFAVTYSIDPEIKFIVKQ